MATFIRWASIIIGAIISLNVGRYYGAVPGMVCIVLVVGAGHLLTKKLTAPPRTYP